MDTHIVHSHDHDRNRHPQDAGGLHQGEEEDHHEKKSVLMKVKEKAKKIKEKITQGYGREHDHHDLDEEDDDDEVEDPDVHGATTIRSGAPGQGDILKAPIAKFGDTEAMHDLDRPTAAPNLERTDPMRDSVPVVASGVILMHDDDVLDPLMADNYNSSGSTMGSHFGQEEEVPGEPNTPVSSFGEHKSNVADPSHTFLSGNEGHLDLGQSRVNTNTTPVSSLGEHKSKTTDPSSETFVTGKEGHLGQSNEGHLGQSMANPQAYTPSNYETDQVTDPTHSGGDDQEVGVTSILHSLDKMNIHSGSQDQFSAGPEKPSNQSSSYTEKIPSATSAIADKAISAKNAEASKLGFGGNNDQHGEDVKPHAYSTPSNYPTNAGGEEQKQHQNLLGTETSNSNLSTGSHDQFSAEKQTHPHDTTTEKPSNQSSSYAEMISSATSAIADKAASAKNVVASQLGYGGNSDHQHEEVGAKSGSAAAPEQHGNKGIATTVTEKLTPLCEKVAGAGGAGKSKTHGGGNSTDGREAHQGATGGDCNKSGQDKGVSVKDYFAEKLKPGDEDRALSEVISETLHKRKAAEHSGTRPVAKVTESEEVTRRLGPDYEAETLEQSSYGKVVADTLKGVVGSLFGKGADQTATSQQSPGSSTGTEGFSGSGGGVAEHRGQHDGVEQPRLQGSDKATEK